MNIEKYGFERLDLVVVTAVNAYLKNLTPEARGKTLSEIVNDMFNEKSRDSMEWREEATQADMDRI